MHMVWHDFYNTDTNVMACCDLAKRGFGNIPLHELAEHLVSVFCDENDVPYVKADFVGILI